MFIMGVSGIWTGQKKQSNAFYLTADPRRLTLTLKRGSSTSNVEILVFDIL